jgi:8-amino-7-oxononanoate synthase
LIDFLRNRAATWIYTTGLSPADTAAALAAIQLMQQVPQRRHQLWENMDFLKTELDRMLGQNLPTAIAIQRLPSDSPILCLEFPSAQTVLQASQALQQAGLWVAAVRPPTVPTSRLRITVMTTHQRQHLEQLVSTLRQQLQQ